MSQKRAYFIGIAGMGMSAAAILLKEQGWEVGGSDTEVYPPATTQLERHRIPYYTSYNPAQIPKDVELIVIGKNAKLTRKNPEVRAAYESGVRIASFPEILGEIVKDRSPIVVAGSYGKSTTTALIAWMLSRSGVDAGWFIGAAPEGMEPAHLGTHSVFVLEGDEYPTSHEDSRPKFAHYAPRDALITAASHDHVNIYKTQEEFLKPFRQLVKELPTNGLLVLCAEEKYAQSLSKETSAQVVLYGMNPAATWRAANIIHAEKTTFDLVHNSQRIAKLSTTLLGDHNVQNTVGASALLIEKKLLTPEQVAAALPAFRGLARRLDKKTSRARVSAYEGFGSSREKLQAAIQALRVQHPEKRLVVVFEPHTFSWRNKKMLYWFDDAFEGAGLVILYKPAEQGADTHDQATQEEMAERLFAIGIDVRPSATPEEVMQTLASEIRDGDVMLLSSSGPMDGLITSIPLWLETHLGHGVS